MDTKWPEGLLFCILKSGVRLPSAISPKFSRILENLVQLTGITKMPLFDWPYSAPPCWRVRKNRIGYKQDLQRHGGLERCAGCKQKAYPRPAPRKVQLIALLNYSQSTDGNRPDNIHRTTNLSPFPFPRLPHSRAASMTYRFHQSK